MIFLETARLRLRNLSPQDAAVMYDYRNNPLCARYQRGQTKDYSSIVDLVNNHANDAITTVSNFILAVALKTSDEMIGEIVVMPNDGAITLGYTFSYQHHRKGYAFEALSSFIELLHQRYPDWEFICFTDVDNVASMALLKKLGYTDLGYAAKIDSQVFGKWISSEIL